MHDRIRWTAAGALIGVALALVIATFLRVAYWVDPATAGEGPSLLAWIAATVLGAPLNLAVATVLGPLAAAASTILDHRVRQFHVLLGGLVANWTLVGLLYGVWRARGRHRFERGPG
jgi:hypothetical protein